MARRKTAAQPRGHGLTHLDAANRPAMVDVGAKEITHRVAEAEAHVSLPPEVAQALQASGHRTKKGPVFDTAIIAGVMAAKRTHELIPFCHPLGLDKCDVEIEAVDGGLAIRCRVSVHHRTGVEMEALTGATVAALTVYDMCKALSHDIRIGPIRLLEKTGGKRDFTRRASGPAAVSRPAEATGDEPAGTGGHQHAAPQTVVDERRRAVGPLAAAERRPSGSPAKRGSVKGVTARRGRPA